MFSDLRFAIRMLPRSPGFAAVVVATLALGIGANTAIFTIFNAVLLQSLPVREPSRLVIFGDNLGEGTSTGTPPSQSWSLFSTETYDFLKQSRLRLDGLAAVRSGDDPVSVRIGGAPRAERAQAQLVSGDYFGVLGVTPALGRTLAPEDDRPGAAPAAVVSHGFWTERLHADPAAIGRAAFLNGTAYTIVGVAPREFFGHRVRRPPDVWVPLAFQPQIELRPSYIDRPDSYWLTLIGRLAPGATRAETQTAATAALRQFLTDKAGSKLTDEGRRSIAESHIDVADGAGGISGLRFRYSAPLRILLVVVGLVLLLACANVANLLLSRAAARQGEITVRLALGASRGRLARQLLTESALLAALGAAFGVVLARWAVRAILALVVSRGSPVQGVIDGRVLLFTAAAAGLAGLAFGIVPALAAGRSDLVGALKTRDHAAAGGPGGRRAVRTLVVAQIAISLVLLAGATLFAESLGRMESQPLGFDHDHVLLARINPRLAGYKPDGVAALYRRLYDRVGALPGVRSATFARYSPMGGSRSVSSGVVEGYQLKGNESVALETIQVGPAYPETLGIPLLRGRAIGILDVAGATRVGMVNEAFVRKFMPDGNPIGRHFGVSGSRGGAAVEIVGVLKDARFQNSREPIAPAVFTAMLQEATQFALDGEIEIRTSADPASAAGELRRAIADVDPDLPVNDPRTLREQVAANFDSERLSARLVGLFGALALVLACVGLYGVVAQGVVRRTNEIGVRMALGAERRAVLWMILRDTLVLLGVGVAIGAPAAVAAARLVRSQLFGFDAAAPGPFVLAAVALALVALLTGLIPAYRASRVDPMVALRYE